MLIYLCNDMTVDAVRNPVAEKYIEHAFGIILDMEIHGLCDINSQHEWYMVLTYEDHLNHPELYGFNNSCRALYGCTGRLPSFGNALCYFSGSGSGGLENIAVVMVDKETNEYFALDLYSSPCGEVLYPPIDTEAF